MIFSYVSDFNAQLTNLAASLVAALPNETRRILRATITNTDVVPLTVTFYNVPSGGAAVTATLIVSALPIAAGATLELWQIQGHVLNGSDSIWGLASVTAKVNCVIDTLKVT